MSDRKYPLLQEQKNKEYFDGSEMFDLNKANYRIAFSFQGKEDLKLKNDERYVKILALQRGKRDGQLIEKSLNFHRCTTEDFEQFYPIE